MHAPRAALQIDIRAMTTELQILDREALHTTFESWAAEEESLDAELREALEALTAYQSHLDAWQKQLADERTELICLREQFEREQAAAAESQAHSPEAGAEFVAARQKVADLTVSLLARTEELRTLDTRRAELVAELELAHAHERELKSALDEQKQLLHQERSKSADELNHSRQALEQHSESVEAVRRDSKPSTEAPRAANPTNRDRSNGGAVLGSIVEQFGKLRQQRAVDRQGLKKAR